MRIAMKAIISTRVRWEICALVCVLLAASAATIVRAQLGSRNAPIRDTDDGIKYARGQNVVPAFEGWVANPDGTFSLVFGSWNRNWEETMFIPIGPDNHIDPGPADQGQPTVFTPRRGKDLFEIVVPKDFGKKEVVWTLVSRGKTEKAYGALVKEEVLTRHMVLTAGSLNEAAVAGNDDQGDEKDRNQPPTVAFDPVPPVTRPGHATLNVTVADDGYRQRGGGGGGGRGGRGLRVEWMLYRGPALVAFEPRISPAPAPTGGKVSTNVSFTAPGTYVLRAKAIDVGGMEVNKDVTVSVK
jgi:hypothetical protein